MHSRFKILTSLLIILVFAAPSFAFKPIPRNRNPYHNEVHQSYQSTMAAYRSLMSCYQRYHLNPQAYMVAYYRYARQLATYKAILHRYNHWRPQPGPKPYPEPYPNPQPQYETKRVLIQAEQLFHPCVMPGPVNLGQISGKNVHKHANLRPGQLVTFSLVTNPSTGYSWHQQLVGGDNITITKNVNSTSSGQRIGAPSIVTYRIQAKKAGKAVLTLRYRRGWENGAAARLVVISIQAKQLPSTSGKFLAIENHQSRSRITYRVTANSINVVKNYNGREVTLKGKFVRGDTPYSGTVKAIAVSAIGNPTTVDEDPVVDDGNNDNNNSDPGDMPDYGDVIYSY